MEAPRRGATVRGLCKVADGHLNSDGGSGAKRGLSPVDVTTVQERVYQSLRLALLKGEFLPGEQVSIRGLAQALGTSPMPVRDAIARLVAERAFDQSSGRVLQVAPYRADEHEEYIRIRMQIEGFAAEKACRAKDPALIETLRAHNETMREVSRARDFDATLAANQAFHFAIYRAARYPQLLDIISSLWLRTGPILAAAQKDEHLFERLFTIGHRVHGDVIDAFSRRDQRAARRAITLDIRASHFSIRRFYKLAQEERQAGAETA
nr:GntR family transcriptional regulator [Marivibrio halodurans]